tara:strand:- start:337 stop:585 length:249 start_codon:yes stop_codon:yes gene_type:complete
MLEVLIFIIFILNAILFFKVWHQTNHVKDIRDILLHGKTYEEIEEINAKSLEISAKQDADEKKRRKQEQEDKKVKNKTEWPS